MKIICAKCNKPVDYYEWHDNPMNNDRITTVKCHGEAETRVFDKFLLGKEFTDLDLREMKMEAFNEFQVKMVRT